MGIKLNLAAAIAAQKFVQSIVSMGASNRPGADPRVKMCVDANTHDDARWCASRKAATGERCIDDGTNPQMSEQRRLHIAALSRSRGCGNCAEQASLAYFWLKDKKNIRPLEYFNLANADHEFVVIGRDIDRDPADVATWGDEAVVCDAWENKVYFGTDLPLKMLGGGSHKPVRLFGEE